MSWTDPRTWVTNEVVTSSLLNTHLRDNLLAVHHPFQAENSDIDATNTSNEVSMFTSAPVILANSLGSNGWLRCTMWGDYFMNSTARSMTLRVKFGGTTHISAALGTSAGASASRAPWKLDLDIVNQGATNAQLVNTFLMAPWPTGSTSSWDENFRLQICETANGTIDTTSNQTFDITVQFDTAATTYSWRKLCSRVWLAQA